MSSQCSKSATPSPFNASQPSMEIGPGSSQPVQVDNNTLGSSSQADAVNSNDATGEANPESSIEDRKRKKLTSSVWDHFKLKKDNSGVSKAYCNYCNKALGGNTRNGTSNLRQHLDRCPKRNQREVSQMLISHYKRSDGNTNFSNHSFDQDAARTSLAKLIAMHELPMLFVEYEGFRDFMGTVQPMYKNVSRHTMKRDILALYEVEREKVMKLVKGNNSRIAISTDLWTASNQNKGYMAVTAHFVDENWVLQSRLMRFMYVQCPHTTEVLSDSLMDCIIDWDIERKLSTVTVDNCSTNDAMIRNLLDRLDSSSLMLRGSLFHMRCCAHVLNLIVKDGLDVIVDAIGRIRSSVAFWTASPKREEKFEETVKYLRINSTKKLCLDCRTRWNSTYLMLTSALIYKDAFSRLKQREPAYKSLPSDEDWLFAKEICAKLRIFYNVTELFSGTKYHTTNLYFPYVCEIRLALLRWLEDLNPIITKMASSMLEKFNAYWDIIHGILGIAVVLDPRYKMKLLECNFRLIYGEHDAFIEVERVRNFCYDLLKEYHAKSKEQSQANQEGNGLGVSTSSSLNGKEECELESLKHFDKYVSLSSLGYGDEAKAELDHYLEEQLLPRTTTFDILGWWRINGVKFPTLRMIARDVLAIPVSTVASESTFSTSGRWVTPNRNKFHAKTLEAMICTQNWLWMVRRGQSTSCQASPSKVVDEEDEPEDEVPNR